MRRSPAVMDKVSALIPASPATVWMLVAISAARERKSWDEAESSPFAIIFRPRMAAQATTPGRREVR